MSLFIWNLNLVYYNSFKRQRRTAGKQINFIFEINDIFYKNIFLDFPSGKYTVNKLNRFSILRRADAANFSYEIVDRKCFWFFYLSFLKVNNDTSKPTSPDRYALTISTPVVCCAQIAARKTCTNNMKRAVKRTKNAAFVRARSVLLSTQRYPRNGGVDKYGRLFTILSAPPRVQACLLFYRKACNHNYITNHSRPSRLRSQPTDILLCCYWWKK